MEKKYTDLKKKHIELFRKNAELVRKNAELVRKNAELVRKNTKFLQKIELQKDYIKYLVTENYIKIYKIRKELLYTPEGVYNKYKTPKNLPSVVKIK